MQTSMTEKELLSKIARTKFESKSQPGHGASVTTGSCYQRSQEQSLKANHNQRVTEHLI